MERKGIVMGIHVSWSEITPGALLGLIPFLLLATALFGARLHRLRILAAAAAAIGLVHAFYSSKNPVMAAGWGMLLAAALLLLARRFHAGSKVRFTADEESMLGGLLAGLDRGRARHLLDQGFWLNGREGDALTREEEAVSHLFYLASGEARVMSRNRQVGLCRAGDLVGEVTVRSGERASATVILNGPARFWCAPANVLRPYLEANHDVRHVLEQGFATALRSKLRASNQRIAETGTVAA